MPSAYDPRARQLSITHNPVQRIPLETGKLAPFDPSVMLTSVFDQLVEVIKDATGIDLSELFSMFDELAIDFSSPEAFVTSLVNAIVALPEILATLVTQVVAVLMTIPDMLMDLLMKLVEQLANLTGIDLTDFLALLDDIELDFSNPFAFLKSLADALIDIGTGLLGPNSPLNAFNLFNLIPKNLIGQVSSSVIGDFFDNLLDNPFFENLESIASSVWHWDEGQRHAPVGGSAKVIADGSGSKDLLSNLIPVSKDQMLDLFAWVKYTGLTGTGTPIQMGVTNYLNGSAVGQPVIASQGLVPPTSDWRKLSGTYTVPAGVDAVRLRLTVAPSATGGTVWWDDTNLGKTNSLLQRLVAGQDGGTLTNDIENLFGGIMLNANNILNRALKGDLTALQQALDPSGILANIEDRINSFLHPASPLNGSNITSGGILDDFLPGVRTTIDNIFGRLFNLPGSGYTHTDSSNALAHVADTLAGLGSQVNQLMALQTTGTTKGDEFERTGSSLGAEWEVCYPQGSATGLECDGHNAIFKSSGSSDRTATARYVPLTTVDDYQVCRVTLNSKADAPGLFGDPAYNDVLGRMSPKDTGTNKHLNFIRFRIGGGRAWLYRVVNGIEQEMAYGTYSGSDPGPGSILTLVCGDKPNGQKRYFEGRHNNNRIIWVTEVGTASMVGSGFRGGGFGGHWNNWTLAQSTPGDVRQWTGGDQ